MQDKKDNLEERLFELNGQFDIEEPEIGHFNRFEAKLARQDATKSKWNPNTWKWLAVAASIALVFSIGFNSFKSESEGFELADVSPKMEETQSFFVLTIKSELEQINLKRNEDNKQVIDDALKQLDKLEKNYKELTVELKTSNKDKRIIYAMISNYQQRIEVLQFLLEQLDEIEQFKNTNNEETII